MPVIETGAGICHCYFHSSGSLEKGKAIVCNAKTRRVSVCNALDCLLIDRSRLADLPELVSPLAACQVEIYADDEAYGVLKGKYERLEHASEESWGREYLDYKMSVRVLSGLEEALEHIACYSSHHSESVVAEDPEVCRIFPGKWMLPAFIRIFLLPSLMEDNSDLELKSVFPPRNCMLVVRWLYLN